MRNTAFADLLDGLASTLQETAAAARKLAGTPEFDDLPPVLTTRDLARLENQSTTTIWRRALLGEVGGLPPTIDPPRANAPLRWYREAYLEHRRRKARLDTGAQPARGRAADPVNPGAAGALADAPRI
jgi:hypothetical protein